MQGQLFSPSFGLGGSDERPNLELIREPRTLARGSDPETSQQAAAAAERRNPSQRDRLLRAYMIAGDRGLTDEEAGVSAGLSGSGYWKRCSDLRNLGLIAPLGPLREVSSGLMAQVCAITPEGWRRMDELSRRAG
jgi:hypothetical protein